MLRNRGRPVRLRKSVCPNVARTRISACHDDPAIMAGRTRRVQLRQRRDAIIPMRRHLDLEQLRMRSIAGCPRGESQPPQLTHTDSPRAESDALITSVPRSTPPSTSTSARPRPPRPHRKNSMLPCRGRRARGLETYTTSAPCDRERASSAVAYPHDERAFMCCSSDEDRYSHALLIAGIAEPFTHVRRLIRSRSRGHTRHDPL